MSSRAMVLEGAGDSLLVFLPGFLNSPSAYADLLAPLSACGTTVVVEQLYARGPAVLTGRFTVRDEAAAAVAVVRRETAARRPAHRGAGRALARRPGGVPRRRRAGHGR